MTNCVVPPVDGVVAELAPDQHADAHLPEAERPRALPRMPLPLDAVHFLREKNFHAMSSPPSSCERTSRIHTDV